LAGGYDEGMGARRVDWFDIFAYGLCAWFIVGGVSIACLFVYFALGYGFGD
jgi:hypothetical protein